MKKIILVLTFICSCSVFATNSSTAVVPLEKTDLIFSYQLDQKLELDEKNCTQFAAIMCELLEELEGCMSSEDYNSVYNSMLTFCNNY